MTPYHLYKSYPAGLARILMKAAEDPASLNETERLQLRDHAEDTRDDNAESLKDEWWGQGYEAGYADGVNA